MTTLKQIMQSNYEAVKNRGLIDDETTLPDFITKLQEEIGEFIKAKDEAEAAAELADIVGVCLNIASHYGIDLPAELGVMVRRNEVRARQVPVITVIYESTNGFSWYNHEMSGTVTPQKQDYGLFRDLMERQEEVKLYSKSGSEINGTFRISSVYIENETLYIDVYRREFNKYEAPPSLRDLCETKQKKPVLKFDYVVAEYDDPNRIIVDVEYSAKKYRKFLNFMHRQQIVELYHKDSMIYKGEYLINCVTKGDYLTIDLLKQ